MISPKQPKMKLDGDSKVGEHQVLDDDHAESIVDDGSSVTESLQLQGKKQGRRAPANSQPRKRVRGRQGGLQGLMKMPIEIFTEISYLLTPGDLISLSWSNRFFRSLLLQRSSIKMWRRAESNIPGLPPCPVGMCEPQYAALLFAKSCSLCGANATTKPDPYLHARLCVSCRNENLMEIEPWLEPKLVERDLVDYSECTGAKLKISRRPRGDDRAVFSLKDAISDVLGKQRQFQEAGDKAGLVKWEKDRRQAISARRKHGDELRAYLDLVNKSRGDELDTVRQQRKDTVTERLHALGWTDLELKLNFVGRDLWHTLVEVPKPLTERIWNNILPKLVPILEDNREKQAGYDSRVRKCSRRRLIDKFITQEKLAEHPLGPILDTFKSELPAVDSIPYAYRLNRYLPDTQFALTWDCLADLSETEISNEEVEMELQRREDQIGKKIVEWRDSVELRLMSNFEDAAGKSHENPLLVIKGSTDLAAGLSEHQRILLRADTAFKTDNPDDESLPYWCSMKDENSPYYYPCLVTMLYERFSEYAPWNKPAREPDPPKDLNLGAFQRNNLVERILKLLLRDLGMPDATRMELLVVRSRFICGRCIDQEPKTWDQLVDHYISAPKRWEEKRDSHPLYSFKYPIVYRNVHDLECTTNSKPLVQLLTKEEVERTLLGAGLSRSNSPLCLLCVANGRGYYRFLTGELELHLHDVHDVTNPVEDLHYGLSSPGLTGKEWCKAWDAFHLGEAVGDKAEAVS